MSDVNFARVMGAVFLLLATLALITGHLAQSAAFVAASSAYAVGASLHRRMDGRR